MLLGGSIAATCMLAQSCRLVLMCRVVGSGAQFVWRYCAMFLVSVCNCLALSSSPHARRKIVGHGKTSRSVSPLHDGSHPRHSAHRRPRGWRRCCFTDDGESVTGALRRLPDDTAQSGYRPADGTWVRRRLRGDGGPRSGGLATVLVAVPSPPAINASSRKVNLRTG